jgi:hypothetical protein
MLGKVAQRKIPKLLADLPFRRIAVLVQCFQIAEYPCKFVSRDAEFFGIHDSLPL